ncbi:MAG: UPF0149 family protein [Enterobacterales bacterium]|nr:UPF0149 family protein [Enterobacterales bacterium]
MANFNEKATELYEIFDEILADADCEMRVSEYQGLLSGLISAGLNQLSGINYSMLSELAHDGNGLDATLRDKIDALFQSSQQAFTDEDQLTPILIPDDSYPIIDRMEALGLWCQGFLLGFGLHSGQQNRLGPEINEALQDISQIANIDIQSDNSESSQVALETLIEHIKVAVKMIYLEQVLKPTQKRSESLKPTIH